MSTSNKVFGWNGSEWEQFPGTSGTDIRSLSTHNGELLVGGFTGWINDHRVAGWARWSAGAGWFRAQPAPVMVRMGESFSLTARLASGYADSTLRWYRNGSSLEDGPGGASEAGGVVTGSATPTVTVTTAASSDSGHYHLSSEFAGILSGSESVRVVVACPADLDDGVSSGQPDGGVDVNDLLHFLAGFEAGTMDLDDDGDPAVSSPDGGTDISDLLFFLARFEMGC